MPPKILFIKWGSFSFINDSILKILSSNFQDKKIDIIDVQDIWKNKFRFYHYLINTWFFVVEYGIDFLSGNKKRSKQNIISWFLGTSYFSLLTSRYIKKKAKGEQYLFTFQTQSVFNGKIKDTPHFIYTDHTTLANLLYPDINPKEYIRSKRFIKKAERAIYNDANMIFTCGSLISKSLQEQYKISAEKVITAFAGSNATSNFIADTNRALAKNILFVGVEWERKGGPVLLKVFEKVLQKHPGATLTIVGCKPTTGNLPNCVVVGKVAATELFNYYNKATIFCLPTLREPFGIVFVEAMHYKLPIVANNIGSIPDMVINNYNGYLVNNNIDEYAERICFLLENPEKSKQLGENGFQHAQSKFSWDLVGENIKTNINKFL